VNGRRPVLVAPDKFKGTLTAPEAAAAIGRGLIAGGLALVEALPVADGGEGTMECIVQALGGRLAAVEAHDPLGRRVHAAFGLVESGRTAIVEMAQASGLWRLRPDERDSMAASTRGTGELIAAAIESGAREVIVGVGGSATTDGGRGALEALGARFTKTSADVTEVRRVLRRVKLAVACDVRAPLLGDAGAARAFAPQKGASDDEVERLERHLRDWARLARKTTGREIAELPMAGAGGGFAGGLWAFAGAEMRPGAALLLEALGFDARMRDAHAVVTGEGRLDEQTLAGKAVFEVSTRCRQAGVPCYAVVGQDEFDAFERRLMNLEVEAAARPGQSASVDQIEQAARRLARRLVPSATAPRASVRSPRRSRRS
jgi:glycerate kinase